MDMDGMATGSSGARLAWATAAGFLCLAGWGAGLGRRLFQRGEPVRMQSLGRMGDGIGVGGVEKRLLFGRKAGIDEAGKVLGVDLRGLQLLLDGIGLSAFDGFAGGQDPVRPGARSEAGCW